jgi:serine/threonine protein kinase
MIKNNEIYLIDFGLATFFIGEDGQHLQNESVDTIIGSPRWISRNILEGNRYSRRDDMISLGYIYCYLVLERTPWELEESDIIRINCKFNNLEKIDKININHPINIWRKENRILDIFKNILEGYPKIYDYLKTVYSYSYMDIPKYDLLVKICIE